MSKLRNLLIGAGLATVGAIGTKKAVDYLRNRGKEEPVDDNQDDQEATSTEEVAFAVVEANSVQDFLDQSFGKPGRYSPTRSPKVFEYQGENYMVIWAKDNQQNKNQMLAFVYNDQGRDMIASVGYTSEATDYNLDLGKTPFSVEVNGKKLKMGKDKTEGTTEDVDFVLS